MSFPLRGKAFFVVRSEKLEVRSWKLEVRSEKWEVRSPIHALVRVSTNQYGDRFLFVERLNPE